MLLFDLAITHKVYAQKRVTMCFCLASVPQQSPLRHQLMQNWGRDSQKLKRLKRQACSYIATRPRLGGWSFTWTSREELCHKSKACLASRRGNLAWPDLISAFVSTAEIRWYGLNASLTLASSMPQGNLKSLDWIFHGALFTLFKPCSAM